MRFVNRIFNSFLISNDEDLTAEEVFKISFANVVNFFLLVYSVSVGLNFLFQEQLVAALVNLIFSLIFVLYFVDLYLTKWSRIFEITNRAIIFAFFLAIYANSAYLNYTGLTIIIYPFIAIIMSGRRAGVLLSFLHILLILIYSYIIQKVDIDFIKFSWLEIINMALVQIASIFVYYIAIRWLSNLIYDKIHEVISLTNEIKVKGDLLDSLTNQLKSPLKDIDNASTMLSSEHLNVLQTELSNTIKASAKNIESTINSTLLASKYNIQPMEQENIVFNIYSLISNVLLLHGKKQSSISISSEVPQNVLGNSISTRQILLSILDSLDRKFNLSNTPIKINVSLTDLTAQDISLTYLITINKYIIIDRRDLSSSDSVIIEMLELDLTRRMILASNGEIFISTENDELEIEVTLPYKNVTNKILDGDDSDEDLSKPLMRNYVTLENANILIVDDNIINQKIVSMFIKDSVKKVATATSGKEAINLFENSKFDLILLDLQMPEMDGFTTARKIREIESGFGKRIPIIAVTANSYDDNEARCWEAGMDGYISKPFKAEDLLNLMIKNLETY